MASDTSSEWLARRGSGRLAADLREELLRAMRAGDFPDGRLPPEAQLAQDLGVSRHSVRAALQSLADDGIVTRRRRHGTVINERVLRGSVPLNRFVSFRDLVEESGYACTTQPLHRALAVPPAEVAELIGLAPGDPCLVVERLLLADGVPVITVRDAIDPRWLSGPVDDVPGTDSTFTFLAEHTTASADHSTLEVHPLVAGAGDPRHLDLPPGTPYAELREVLFSPDGEPVAFSRIAVDVRRIRLRLARRGS